MTKVVLSITSQIDYDSIIEVSATVDGDPVMTVTIDATDTSEDGENHKLTTAVLHPMNYYEQAAIIMGAAELVDAQFSGAEEVFEIEI